MRDLKSLGAPWWNPCWIMILSFMEILFPATKRIRVEKVMIPSPPNWNRTRITAWPNGVKYVAVSWTIRPVTQTPDVAVKRASTREIWPDFVLKGRRRRKVPPNMATIKLIARNWAGWNLLSALIGCLLFKPSSLSWLRYQIYSLIKILSINFIYYV